MRILVLLFLLGSCTNQPVGGGKGQRINTGSPTEKDSSVVDYFRPIEKSFDEEHLNGVWASSDTSNAHFIFYDDSYVNFFDSQEKHVFQLDCNYLNIYIEEDTVAYQVLSLTPNRLMFLNLINDTIELVKIH
jgi:hypothetical protein